LVLEVVSLTMAELVLLSAVTVSDSVLLDSVGLEVILVG
jgi:hypothetical protein